MSDVIENDKQDRRRIIGYEKVPRVQRSITRPGARIIYFFSRDNPYNPYDEVVRKLEGQPKDKIKERAYGIPLRSRQATFPLFSDKVHVVPWSAIPRVGTRYHFCDPCGGSRNWFMHWLIVDPLGRHFIYREWPMAEKYIPGEGFPGAWAEPDAKKEDGRRGDGQRGFGWGLNKYKEEIERVEAGDFHKSEAEVQADLRRLEELKASGRITPRQAKERREALLAAGDGEVMEARFMDRRYGNAKSSAAAKDDAETLIEACAEIGLDFGETASDDIDQGIIKINNMLAYDTTKPLGFGNEPMLYIYEGCLNTIFGFKTWTGKDGRHGATKDPIDLLRYEALAGLEYVDPMAQRGHKGGAY